MDFRQAAQLIARIMKFLAALISLAAFVHARPAMDRPNLIVILLDDAGYGDFSHTGHPTIHTPNVTRLAMEGANLPQFYSGSPACTASRYSLLTGRNPGRSGLGTWVLGPGDARHLHPKEMTLAEGLKARGYRTAIYGKWHLGTPNAANEFTADAFPLAHGFDRWEGTNVSNDYTQPPVRLIRSKPDGTSPIAGYEVIEPNLATAIPVHEDLTRRYRDLSIDFIRENKDQPFFLYLAPNMPHLPVHPGKDFQGKSRRGAYGDCIEEIDAMVGSLLGTLESEGIAENTLIVFTSDNGPWIRFQETEKHPLYGEARTLIGSALPFRDGKGSTWEGGMRVVGACYWPGTIAPRTVVREPASLMDILPTALNLAGAKVPEDRPIDGRDIRPLLAPERFPGKVTDFELIYTGAPDNRIYAIRQGPWKLHVRLSSQTGSNHGFSASREKPLLFQIEHDPGEQIDRASAEPGKVRDLLENIEFFEQSLQKSPSFWASP